MSENNFTQIPNGILEAIAASRPFPWGSAKCLFLIVRKTFGFHKECDTISLSQFSKATGLTRPHVSRALSWLIEKKIIEKSVQQKRPAYKINDPSLWVLPVQGTPPSGNSLQRQSGVPCTGNKVLPLQGHTKETLTKENSNKCTHHPPTPKTPDSNITTTTSGDSDDVTELVSAFHKKFPKQLKQYSNGAVVKAREEFLKRLKEGWTKEEILHQIEAYNLDDSPAPWDIFKELRGGDKPPYGPGTEFPTQEDYSNRIKSMV